MSPQLALPFEHRPSLDRRDFISGPSNQAAAALVDAWPDWPHPVAILHGPAGSGKTHLATAWARRAGARMIDGAGLTLDRLATALAHPAAQATRSAGPAIVVEQADRTAERPLLHLHNLVLEAGGHLLLTARAAPSAWPHSLADLRSRLAAALPAALGQPDDEVLAGVLRKLLADRQLTVADPVVSYLVSRMERSLAGAALMVDKLDRESLAAARPITVALARRILEEDEAEDNEQLPLAL